VLSEDEPFDEAKPYGESEKVIIFLTDARSGMGPSNPKHNNEDDVADSIWQTQCTNIKAKDIALYTIAFDTGSSQKDKMEECATTSAHAFTADKRVNSRPPLRTSQRNWQRFICRNNGKTSQLIMPGPPHSGDRLAG
jgi:hypothetical protein